MQLSGGHAAAVASDASRVAAVVNVLETWDRRKVEGCKCAGLSQGVSTRTD